MQQIECNFSDENYNLEPEFSQTWKNLREEEKNILKIGKDNEDPSPLSKSLLDILNKSQDMNFENENFHQKVVTELEKQVSQMRKDWLKETENMMKKWNSKLNKQKEIYEQYLSDIRDCYHQDRKNLEDRIKQLQEQEQNLNNNSSISGVSKEMSMMHLVEQLALMANKYSDLKISSNEEITKLKAKITKFGVEKLKQKEINCQLKSELEKWK